MEQLSATRSELIARRLQIGLATQGRDLLKEKRAALVVEFGHLSTGVLEAVELLGRRREAWVMAHETSGMGG